MTENLRIMSNRMVLLNPLVSLLKKQAPNTAPNDSGASRATNKYPVQYVKSEGEEADSNLAPMSSQTNNRVATGFTNNTRREGDEVIVN